MSKNDYKSRYRITDCKNQVAMEEYISKEEYLILSKFFQKFKKATENFIFENVDGDRY